MDGIVNDSWRGRWRVPAAVDQNGLPDRRPLVDFMTAAMTADEHGYQASMYDRLPRTDDLEVHVTLASEPDTAVSKDCCCSNLYN